MLSAHEEEQPDDSVRLRIDDRSRVTLGKLLTDDEAAKISSFLAYRKDNQIILEPQIEVPAEQALHEGTVWLTPDEWDKFSEILDAPTTINSNLKQAFQRFSDAQNKDS